MKIVQTNTPTDVRLFEGIDYPSNLEPTDVVELTPVKLTSIP